MLLKGTFKFQLELNLKKEICKIKIMNNFLRFKMGKMGEILGYNSSNLIKIVRIVSNNEKIRILFCCPTREDSARSFFGYYR